MTAGTNVLQICSYYTGSALYKNLFFGLEALGINQTVYVFTHKGYTHSDIVPSNVHISQCFRRAERLLFHLKHERVIKDLRGRSNMEQYNMAHAHSLFSNGYIAYRLKKELGLPYIVAVRNTDVNVFF